MTDEPTTDGTGEISRPLLVTVAVARFRKRFPATPDAIGQRMRLLLNLLDRVEEHAKSYGIAAVFATQDGMNAFAYDRWDEHRAQHPGGQQNQAVQEPLPRLVNYWKRELASGGTGRDGSTFVRDAHYRVESVPGGFVIVEEIPDPFEKRKLLRVQFRIRHAKDRLAALVIGEAEEREEGNQKRDPRLVLPARSAVRQLHENAQALVTAFKESERSAFRYIDRGTQVEVAPALEVRGTQERPRRFAKAAAACFVALLALGGLGRCAAAGYSRAVAAGVERFSLITLIGANGYCDPATGRPAIVVDWGPAITPASVFTNAQLVRNGRVIATVDGRTQFRDMRVERGRYYEYTLQLADVFGNILVRDMAAGSDHARCPGDPPSAPHVTLVPAGGTFETTFTANVRPPADEGRPISHGWQLKASRLGARRQVVTPPLSVTDTPSRPMRFSPCTCGPLGRTAAGTYQWLCEAKVYVTFADGHIVSYNSLPVTISEPIDHPCTPDELRHSDAQQ